MGYRLSCRQRNRFLHFRIEGDNSPETVRAYVSEVRAFGEKEGCDRILIEENLLGKSLAVVDIFSLLSDSSGRGWSGIRRMAFVDTNPEHDTAKMQFAENVAVNRGVNLRVFPTVEAARKWLEEEDPPQAS
ncbi:MAG: hypothetical protein ACRD16_06665 [Thermoanaerobaculia bacterium]